MTEQLSDWSSLQIMCSTLLLNVIQGLFPQQERGGVIFHRSLSIFLYLYGIRPLSSPKYPDRTYFLNWSKYVCPTGYLFTVEVDIAT